MPWKCIDSAMKTERAPSNIESAGLLYLMHGKYDKFSFIRIPPSFLVSKKNLYSDNGFSSSTNPKKIKKKDRTNGFRKPNPNIQIP